jgi:dTDP-4-dehydrorhamnose reductase
MPEEPRTEVLRRRIELYLHCIGEGISTAELSDFVRLIAEAEDELLMLSTERTSRYDFAAHGSR